MLEVTDVKGTEYAIRRGVLSQKMSAGMVRNLGTGVDRLATLGQIAWPAQGRNRQSGVMVPAVSNQGLA